MDQGAVMGEKLSAFVITYNRPSLLESCLRALSFVDELIVVDKSSPDNSTAIAARYADRVEIVPWSPTVEETRAYALSLCSHEWILFLDDDELLTPAAEPYLRDVLTGSNMDIFTIPYRHYILGQHDERAYYWPETRHCLFRRGAVEFTPTVHGGVALLSDRITNIPVKTGVCIHHLSYPDVASWIDRTNRYTGRPDRVQIEGGEDDLIRFSHDRIDYWIQRTSDTARDDYPAAVALLRAIYDMVDRLKGWEAAQGHDAAEMFRITQDNLAPAPEESVVRDGIRHHECPRMRKSRLSCFETPLVRAEEVIGPIGLAGDLDDQRPLEIQAMLVQLRATEAHLRERTDVARKTASSLAAMHADRDETICALEDSRRELTRTRHDLDQTRHDLDQTRHDLDRTTNVLDQTKGRLGEVRQDFEELSNSARLFIRQYLPKLRHYLLRGVP
jgi:glycosyltransferase involved in cell wall biosynthesis